MGLTRRSAASGRLCASSGRLGRACSWCPGSRCHRRCAVRPGARCDCRPARSGRRGRDSVDGHGGHHGHAPGEVRQPPGHVGHPVRDDARPADADPDEQPAVRWRRVHRHGHAARQHPARRGPPCHRLQRRQSATASVRVTTMPAPAACRPATDSTSAAANTGLSAGRPGADRRRCRRWRHRVAPPLRHSVLTLTAAPANRAPPASRIAHLVRRARGTSSLSVPLVRATVG